MREKWGLGGRDGGEGEEICWWMLISHLLLAEDSLQL